jgi:hypothetical protein
VGYLDRDGGANLSSEEIIAKLSLEELTRITRDAPASAATGVGRGSGHTKAG